MSKQIASWSRNFPDTSEAVVMIASPLLIHWYLDCFSVAMQLSISPRVMPNSSFGLGWAAVFRLLVLGIIACRE